MPMCHSFIGHCRDFLSVLLERPHPLGPIRGQNPAGLRPRPGGLERPMPFQRPKLLEPHLPHGAIHEQAVHRPVMAVDAAAGSCDCRRSTSYSHSDAGAFVCRGHKSKRSASRNMGTLLAFGTSGGPASHPLRAHPLVVGVRSWDPTSPEWESHNHSVRSCPRFHVGP